jgi:hypothetical protein
MLELCAFLLVAWALDRFVDRAYRRNGTGPVTGPATASAPGPDGPGLPAAPDPPEREPVAAGR